MGRNKLENSERKFCPCCGGITERYLSIKEVAQITSTSEDTWRKRIRERSIEFVKVGGSVRIAYSTINEIITVMPAINTQTINQFRSN